MRKIFLRYRIIVFVLLGLLLVLGIAWLRLDSAIASNLRSAIATTLGVPARIERLHYRLFDGELAIERLTIDNPEGFATPYFMTATDLNVRAKPSTFLRQKTELQSFTIQSLDLNIEQQLTNNNILKIFGNIQQHRKGNLQANLLDRGKKFELERAIVNRVTAHLNLAPNARIQPLSLDLPPIATLELNNITPEILGGIVLSDLIDRVVSSIVKKAISQSQAAIPQSILRILENFPFSEELKKELKI